MFLSEFLIDFATRVLLFISFFIVLCLNATGCLVVFVYLIVCWLIINNFNFTIRNSMAKLKPLTTEQIIERAKYCRENAVCFITKENLLADPLIIDHPEAGRVLVNSMRANGISNMREEQQSGCNACCCDDKSEVSTQCGCSGESGV